MSLKGGQGGEGVTNHVTNVNKCSTTSLPPRADLGGGERGKFRQGGGVPPPKIFREGQEPPGIFPGGGRLYLPPPEYRCMFKIKESIRYISIFS